MPSRHATENRFLSQPIARLFWANALPMILIMLMNGLLSLVDALFLGRFVGVEALGAVSLVFPLTMLTIALSTLVSGGMSSQLARHLGAGERQAAGAVFARAHGLALLLALALIAVFALAGGWITLRLAGGDPLLAGMAWSYLAITLGGAPVQFWLGLHGDVLRNEGRAGLMALLSVLVTLANIALNYALIVRLEMGVAGSAWGTVGAQLLGLSLLVGLRLRGGVVPLAVLARQSWRGGWGRILALGAPMSLGFTGIALVSALVITTLRATSGTDYPAMVAAYGIVTRLMGFTFLPIMALGLATQSIAGNNAGAGRMDRAGAALKVALASTALYCGTVAALMMGAGGALGALFVADPGVSGRVAGILRPTMILYVTQGPVMMLSMYYQALGMARRSAVLSLVRPYLLMPLLVPGLGLTLGAGAIWYAFPLADLCVATLALSLWWRGRAGRLA